MRKNIILLFAATSLYAGAQHISIPDTTFKAYLLENFDTNNDGEISVEEARTVRKIECTDKPLTSLQGIEYFTLWRNSTVRMPTISNMAALPHSISAGIRH